MAICYVLTVSYREGGGDCVGIFKKRKFAVRKAEELVGESYLNDDGFCNSEEGYWGTEEESYSLSEQDL